MRWIGVGLLAGLLGWTASSVGQDEEKANPVGKLKSIPQSFRAYVVVDDRFDVKDVRNRTGKFHCFVCEHGLVPAVAVFVRTVPREVDGQPLIKLFGQLNDAAIKFKAERLGVYAIFLNLDQRYEDDLKREDKVAAVAGIGKELKLPQVPFAIAAATIAQGDEKVPSPEVAAFQIGPDDEVTVIFYNRFEILNRWVFTNDKPMTDADVTAVRAAIDKVLTPPARVSRFKKADPPKKESPK